MITEPSDADAFARELLVPIAAVGGHEPESAARLARRFGAPLACVLLQSAYRGSSPSLSAGPGGWYSVSVVATGHT